MAVVPLNGKGPSRTLLSLPHPTTALDAGPDGSIYLDQVELKTELLRFSAEGGHIEKVGAIASPDALGYFTVLPDGRAVGGEQNGSRARLVAMQAGKDPSPLINTTEETAGPVTPVGAGEIAFMVGPPPRQTIALATLSNGRITRRIAFQEGFPTELAASPDGKTLYCVAAGAVWSVPLSGGPVRRLRNGDSVSLDASSNSLVVQVREPPPSRLVRVPLSGGPEQEIAGSFHLGNYVDGGSIRDGRLVAPMSAPTWYWPAGIFDLTTGKAARIPLDYNIDFHHMTWTPDGRVIAVADRDYGTIWKFTPDSK